MPLENRKHDYRLSQHSAAFFVDVVERCLNGEPQIIEKGEPEMRPVPKRTFAFEPFDQEKGPCYFGLSIQFDDDELDTDAQAFVTTVAGQLITMDDAARAIPCEHDENEELFEIEIDPAARRVQLNYSSTLWNTEWTVHYRFDDGDGWKCLGMPDWRNPGQYIT